MAQTPDTPADDSFKAHTVPFEQRDSQNVKPTPFIQNYAVILSLTALGAVAGFFTGKILEPKNIKLGKLAAWKFGTEKVDRQAGLIVGAEVGGIWGLFHHWKKSEGKQMGIKNLSHDLHEALDTKQIEKESQKEEALLKDLEKLRNAMAEKPAAHASSIASRREEAAAEHVRA